MICEAKYAYCFLFNFYEHIINKLSICKVLLEY